MSQSQKDDFDLLNTFAHDLKTPLASAMSFVDLLQHTSGLSDKQLHYAQRATQALERMEKLVNELLDYARMGATPAIELVECELHPLVEDAVLLVSDLASARGIRIRLELAPNLHPIRANARLLAHGLMNLVSNAVKYNRDGGSVTITTQNAGTKVALIVNDTGIGIPAADLPRIFDRFYRVARSNHVIEGTGLGLAIVQMVIAKHKGQIEVHSVEGEGSTFTVLLPRARSGRKRNPRADAIYNAPMHRNDPTNAGEPLDALDDDLQESREVRDTDSSDEP